MKKGAVIFLCAVFVIISNFRMYGQNKTTGKHDISSIKACELVKPAEVVKIIGGKLLAEPSSVSPSRMYVIEKDNDTHSYQQMLESSARVKEMLKIQTDEEQGERIPGIGDEAYLQKNQIGEGFGLVAVWKGDFALEVKGIEKTAIIEIAKLAAARMDKVK